MEPRLNAQDLDERLAELGALAEPTRRSLYLYVADQPDDVGRDEAAAALGISRAPSCAWATARSTPSPKPTVSSCAA
jgi:hypothetical protein